MKLIRYRTLPGRADENQLLIEAVFSQLEAKRSETLRYVSLRAGDTFLHLADNAVDNPFVDIPAFAEFQRGIKERCEEPPLARDVVIIGNHRMLLR
jgi:hypothetical protein